MKYFTWVPLIEPFKRTNESPKKGLHKLDIKKEGKKQFRNFLGEFENFINTKNISLIKAKIQRKIKRIRVYRLLKEKGRIVKQLLVTNIKGFCSYYGIKETNRVVGYTPNYCGFRPGYPVNFNNVIVKVINENYDSIKGNFPNVYSNLIDSLTNFREVFSGSYDTNSGHIKEFMKDDSTRFDAISIIRECEGSPWLNSPELDLTNIDDLPYVTNYNPQSHNGHYSMRIFESRIKGVTILPAIVLAKRKFELIKKYAIKNFTLWDVFAREKDMKTDVNDSSIIFTTRLVLSTEHYQTLLLSYFFQKLMVSVESFSDTKFHLKSEYDGTKSLKLLQKSQKYDYVIDADWPKFDSSIDSSCLIAAGAIMFSNSLSSKESLRVIFHLISSFVTKYVCIPPGIVVELNRGNPSGHPGVTAINCYVNIIRWIQIGRRVYGDDYHKFMDIEVYGDDAYVFLKHVDNLKNIDSYIIDLGFANIDVYNRLFPTELLLTDIKNAPDFLKRKFSLNGLCWNTSKVLDKMIYQSKRRNIQEQIELIKGFITTAPGDDEFNQFGIFLIKNIIQKYKINGNKTIEEIEEFLINVKRYELSDKTFLKEKIKQDNLLKESKIVNLKRYKDSLKYTHELYFDQKLLNAYFLICENGIFTKYIRSVWKNERQRAYLAFKDFEYNMLEFDNEHKALKFLYIDSS